MNDGRSLKCSIPDCNNGWTSNCGRRLCSIHLHIIGRLGANDWSGRPSLLATVPLREAVRPYSEPIERDDEVPF